LKIRATKHVNSHRVNNDYLVLVLEWGPEDDNFQFLDGLPTWTPRDSEVCQLVGRMLEVSYSFGPKLAKGIENKSRYLARLLRDHSVLKSRLKERS